MATRAQQRVTTERTEVTASDFHAEIIRLGSGESESKNILIYGDSNVGKTILSGTLPERTFWLVCEPGYKTAERWRAKEGLPPHKGARRISDSATALAAVDWLYEKERYTRLQWIVLDGVSTMQDRFRLAYTQEAFDTRGNRAHRNLPDKPDYFNTQNFLKSWFAQLIDLPVNLLVTAHAYRGEDQASGEPFVYPGFQGRGGETANAISGLMDVTGYFVARRMKIKGGGEKVIRRLWFDQPTGQWGGEGVRYVVGDKFDCLGSYMDFPTMPRILTKIDGEGS